jgi:hypothetical protein
LGLEEELARGLIEVVGPDVEGLIVHTDEETGARSVPTCGVLAGLLVKLECCESWVAQLLERWADRTARESILDLEGCRLESYEGHAPLSEWGAYRPAEGTRGWLLKGLRMAHIKLAEGGWRRWEVSVAILLEKAENDLALPKGTAVRDVAILLIGSAFQFGCQLRLLRGVVQ